MNPVSAVGKLSQILFAVVAPGHIVANIVAGALAEAGAMQVGGERSAARASTARVGWQQGLGLQLGEGE